MVFYVYLCFINLNPIAMKKYYYRIVKYEGKKATYFEGMMGSDFAIFGSSRKDAKRFSTEAEANETIRTKLHQFPGSCLLEMNTY